MTCANCGAPMRLDRGKGLLVCDYCTSEAIPPMDEDGVQMAGETKHRCPTCSEHLADGLIERAPILYCPSCRGMLISIEKFQPLVENLRAHRDRPMTFLPPRSDDDKDRELDCPLCGQPMHNHPYGGPGNIHIETCETCFMIWLDRHELRRVVVAPDPRPVYSNYDDPGTPHPASSATGWDTGWKNNDPGQSSPWSFGGPADWD